MWAAGIYAQFRHVHLRGKVEELKRTMRTLLDNPERLDRSSSLVQAILCKLASVDFLPSARPYNLTISHEWKFIWFRVAKVGTRTVLNHLLSSGVKLDANHPYNIFYCPRLYKGYFKFAFARNPWDRLISCWNNKIVAANTDPQFGFTPTEFEKMKKFHNFVDYVGGLDIETCDHHLRSQCSLIDLDRVDYLGRLETFTLDFAAVCKMLRLPCEAIVSKNVSRRGSYREYYDEATIQKVSEIYRKDIQIFKYKF